MIALNFILSVAVIAQTTYHTQVVDIKLNGISNLQGWEMKATWGISDASELPYFGYLEEPLKGTN